MGTLFSELKRRNVVRVGIAYIVLGWVVLQVGDVLFDMFGAPTWVGKSLAAILLLGLPFACLFAWAFELTPEGVMKTADVDRSKSITHSTGRKLDLVIIGALVIALGYFIWERQFMVSPGPDAVLDKSIAVLPFVNMSSDQEQEWFADGLTEEILNSLARTPDLLVASRTSSFQYKGRHEDVSTIAASLGVAHILEGSVRRGGDRLRVTAQLIRASDGFHLWSETFDREPEDVIAIQENVAIEIAKALETAMDPDALAKMVSAGTAFAAAYEAYLEGLAIEARVGETGNIQDWDDALMSFDRARAIDPGFALAHWHTSIYWASQLGVTDIQSILSRASRAERLERYLEAIDSAIDAEQDSTRALRFRADKAHYELRLRDSARLYDRFLAEYPHDQDGLSAAIDNLGWMRDAEAMRGYLPSLMAATYEDPVQLNGVILDLLFVGLEDEAVNMARDGLRRFPEHAFMMYQAHRALLWAGHSDEARQWADVLKSRELPPENIDLVLLRQACADGDITTAEFFLNKVAQTYAGADPAAYYIALQIMNRPDDANRLLVDAELDIYALASFLNYPYFDHTQFPELAAKLEQQGIDRPFTSGPPYRCGT